MNEYDEVVNVLLQVISDVITDEEYNDRQNMIKIRRMDAGELLAHVKITKYRDHKERIIVLLMGEKPGGVSPLVREIMRRKLNAKVYTEYQMIEYALGIKQYVMFFERKI